VARLVLRHDCGAVVEPGDAEGLARTIAALAADRPACARMGERARAMLDAHFTRARSLDRWAQLLSKVTDGGVR
jgi:glycosyltransferase involved in cell wall biosynthesis